MLVNQPQDFASFPSLGGDRHIRLIGYDLAQAARHHGMIVGDQNPDHALTLSVRAGIGNRTTTVTPRPGAPVISISPPAIRARSLMPSRPREPVCSKLSGPIPLPLSVTSSASER